MGDAASPSFNSPPHTPHQLRLVHLPDARNSAPILHARITPHQLRLVHLPDARNSAPIHHARIKLFRVHNRRATARQSHSDGSKSEMQHEQVTKLAAQLEKPSRSETADCARLRTSSWGERSDCCCKSG